jgi:hypothetical protein
MRRLQKAHSREQPGLRIGGRVWLGTQSSLQKMRRSYRPNSRTLQAHHLKGMTKKTTLNELGEMLEFVVKRMATKDDIADVKSTLADHTKILNNHTRDLAVIKNDVTTNLDKRLQLAVRVSAIEKHLGLDKKIVA